MPLSFSIRESDRSIEAYAGASGHVRPVCFSIRESDRSIEAMHTVGTQGNYNQFQYPRVGSFD